MDMLRVLLSLAGAASTHAPLVCRLTCFKCAISSC
jgi:hypothetical protein